MMMKMVGMVILLSLTDESCGHFQKAHEDHGQQDRSAAAAAASVTRGRAVTITTVSEHIDPSFSRKAFRPLLDKNIAKTDGGIKNGRTGICAIIAAVRKK
jgi:hypothetical protein